MLGGAAWVAHVEMHADAAGAKTSAKVMKSWRSRAMLELGASAADVSPLALPDWAADGRREAFTVDVPVEGVVHRAVVRAHSVRSDNFQVRVPRVEGGFDVVDVPLRTVRGEIEGMPGAMLAGSLLEDGLHAMIVRGEGKSPLWVQPLRSMLPQAPAGLHVIYVGDAIAPCEGECGVTDTRLPDVVAAHMPAMMDDLRGEGGENRFCAELACDTDTQYFNSYGSVQSVVNRIELIVNAVNVQYETELDILHGITTIIVRTAEPDPYTSGDASVLLGQVRNEWITNQTDVPYDVVHMFTGRNLIGSTIGIAWQNGALCTDVPFCLAQSDWSNTFACVTNVTAHELGHIWGAGHCDCPNTTMNPVDMCANTFDATTSIPQITAYRDSVDCWTYCEEVELGSAALPFFDDFTEPAIDAVKWTGIDGAVVVTDAGNAPSPPNALALATSREIRSALLDASNAGEAVFKYSWMNRNVGSADDAALQVFYRNNSGQWVMLSEHVAAAGPVGVFTHETFELPLDALSDELRLRFRHITGAGRAETLAGGPAAGFLIDEVQVQTEEVPANNACGGATLITAGFTPFSNQAALASGEGESCGGFESDVWFRFVNSVAGSLTISICDADFDTELAIYGATCPVAGGTAIACAADGCGSGSYVTFAAPTGLYRIRVSGASGARGSGTLLIQQHPTGSCPADLNGDGEVTMHDVLAAVVALGPCVDCESDVVPPPNGDDEITADDISAVLSGFGEACP
jgi:hypothetical protein